MKKFLVVLLSTLLAVATLSACGETEPETKTYTVAIPNDTTNEARALLLLEANGYITLKDGAGITATVMDIKENPYNLKFEEMEAAQLPRVLQDVDFAVINTNYAVPAGLNPMKDSLIIEGAASSYANHLVVKEGNEEKPVLLALKAALESQAVADYIADKYAGSVASAVATLTNGYNDALDYGALDGATVSVACSPTPHAEILNDVVKGILADKNITLNVVEYTDYVLPNNVVESGEIDANYFQHLPYLDDFNANNNTHLVSIGGVHVEPMGLYGGKQSSLDVLKK